MSALKQILLDLIAQNGPMTIASFMNEALYHPRHGYYSTRPALGGEGDFITAPETSQMFGELCGLWAAQSWLEIGAPPTFNLIELGPGSGLMMKDALRAAKTLPAFAEAARVALVEMSAPLSQAQDANLGHVGARFPTLEAAPAGPCIILANEFLDCMAIRQFVRTAQGWREKVVGVRDGALVFGLVTDPLSTDDIIPDALKGAPEGAIAEIRPALPVFMAMLAARLRTNPGRALFFDYGAPETTGGDTLQAVRRHASADPLDAPGEADLTAHVDFAEIKWLAEAAGLSVSGPVSQGAWLKALGIEIRAAALQKSRPDQAVLIARQMHRLIGEDQMGGLFQAICLSSPGLPPAAGFAP